MVIHVMWLKVVGSLRPATLLVSDSSVQRGLSTALLLLCFLLYLHCFSLKMVKFSVTFALPMISDALILKKENEKEAAN